MGRDVDPQIEKALELAKLHRRLRRVSDDVVRDLHVRHAASLRGLEALPDLEVLILSGCGLTTSTDIPNLPKLLSLRVNDSALHDVTLCDRFPRLHIISAERNKIQDLRPLLQCNLGILDVAGNPLSEESYFEVIPKLVERGCKISCSQVREWRVTLRMQHSGIPLNCYEKEGEYYLCSPGLALTGAPEYDHPRIDIDEVESILARDATHLLPLFRKRGGMGKMPSS